MRVEFEMEFLQRVASMLPGFWDKKEKKSFYRSLHFELKGDVVCVSCANRDVTMEMKCPSSSGMFTIGEDGVFAVDGFSFLELMKECPKKGKARLYLGTSYNRKTQKHEEQVAFSIGKGLNMLTEMSSTISESYSPPYSKPISLFDIEAKRFVGLLRKAMVVGNKRDGKRKDYELFGMKMECHKQTLRLVSTDGHRMVLVEGEVAQKHRLDGQGLIAPISLEEGFVCPVSIMETASFAFNWFSEEEKIVASIGPHIERQWLSFSGSVDSFMVTLSCPFSGRTFPEYIKMVEFPCSGEIALFRDEVAACFRQIGSISEEVCIDIVSTELGDVLRVVGLRPGFSAREAMSIGEVWSPQDPSSVLGKITVEDVGLAVDYFLGLVQSIEAEKIRIKFLNKKSPFIISPVGTEEGGGEQRHDVVLMPRLVEMAW